MNNTIIKKCIAFLLVIVALCLVPVMDVQASTTSYIRIQINNKQYKIYYNNKQITQSTTSGSTVSENTTDNYDFKDVIYYCNTSLKESLKIDNNIKQKALSLTQDEAMDYKKAYNIFEFVSNHITYDYERYNIIVNRGNMCNWKAGASYSYYGKKGVCFEYATLFAAMANSIGLKVRLIYGENHIWNQFYNRQTSTWVTVDPTWKKFNFDVNKYHKIYSIQAEF